MQTVGYAGSQVWLGGLVGAESGVGVGSAQPPHKPAPSLRAERSEMRALSQEQVDALITFTKGHRYHALYVLAVTTGMRPRELLGLKWGDINFNVNPPRLTVQRQRQAGVVFTELKTKRARRPIDLSKVAVDALTLHRARQVEERLRTGSAWHDLDLDFANPSGRPLDPTWQPKPFRESLDTVGLSCVRFHDLRHTCATLLLSRGTHPKVVSEMLGHATITLTLDTYSHVVPALHSEAAHVMDAMFGT